MEREGPNLVTFTGGGQSATKVSGELAERIVDLVYEYADVIPLATALGVLEIVKAQILRNAR